MSEEVAIYLRWLVSDEPSVVWQRASNAMLGAGRKPLRWMARALKIDPADSRAWFALAGFAPLEIDGRWHIAAPTYPPDPFDPNATPGDDLVIVDPDANTASLLGCPGPGLVLPSPQPDSLFVHVDPMRWLREWADERVVFLEKRRDAKARSRVIHTLKRQPPAALAIGNIDEIAWGGVYARTIRADFSHHKAIKRAIFRAADLPRVEAA